MLMVYISGVATKGIAGVHNSLATPGILERKIVFFINLNLEFYYKEIKLKKYRKECNDRDKIVAGIM